MLAIRLQRIGRSGHPEYRMIVQDSRRTPSSGKVVAMLGNYNPHTKTATINKEKAELFVKNGAQPSPRVAKILKDEGVSLPKWVEFATKKESAIKNADKLRRNSPAEEVVEEAPVESAAEETATEEAPAVEAEAPAEEA